MRILYLAAFIMLCPNIATAASEKIYPNKLNTCYPSKEVINNYEPKTFQTSNNLLRSAGALPIVCGERLILRGKLLDSNCVPISDAKIYLWQVGCDGKYPYLPLRVKAQGHHINTSSGSSFLGNAIATTDNNGEFQFVTIYPAKSEGGVHVINLRAEHRDIGSIQTQLHPPAGEGTYEFTVVMKDQNLYRRY